MLNGLLALSSGAGHFVQRENYLRGGFLTARFISLHAAVCGTIYLNAYIFAVTRKM